MAKLTNRLKSPKAFGVSLPSCSLVLLFRLNKLGRPALPVLVGEKAEEEGVDSLSDDDGSISMDVRKEVSWRSSLEDVTDKKMSRSFC